MDTLQVMPAYGRRYDDEAACLADWNAGKDFKILGGPYLSKRDEARFSDYGIRQVYCMVQGNAVQLWHVVRRVV